MGTLINLTNSTEFDILSLQEVWLRSYNVATRLIRYLPEFKWTVKLPDMTLHTEDAINVKNLSFHGVAMGMTPALWENTTKLDVEDPNIIAVMLTMGPSRTLIANLYLPTRGSDKEDLFARSLAALGSLFESIEGEFDILLMGDTNVDTDSEPRRLAKWYSFLDEYGLTDNKLGHVTHQHHISKNENELDRYVTRNIKNIKIQVSDMDTSSDHRPVVAEFEIANIPQIPHVQQPKGDKIEVKINLETLLEHKELFAEITDSVAEEIIECNELYNLSTDALNGLLSTSLFRSALAVTGQREYQSQKPRKTRRIKVDPAAYKRLREAKKVFKTLGSVKESPEHRELIEARKDLRHKLRQRVESEEEELVTNIIESARTKSPKLFSQLRKIRQQETVNNSVPSKIEGYGAVYEAPNVLLGFKELFTIQTTLDYLERYDEDAFALSKLNNEALRITGEEDRLEDRLVMTMKDFLSIISKMKSGKAQDFLGNSNDLLKLAGPKMIDLIFHFCRLSLLEGDIGGILRNFGKGVILVKKPGKPVTDVKNWRKIVTNNRVMDVCQKWLQKSVEVKVREIQTRFQLGFTAGVPITNGVVIRNELKVLSKQMKSTLFFGVLDLKSCFPSIPREQLLSLAAEILSPSEWNFLDQIYSNTWGELRIEAQRTDPMFADRGTVEGGVLSTQLLKVFLSVLLTRLDDCGFTSNINFAYNVVEPGQIAIADDVLLYSWSAEDMRVMLRICQDWTNEFRATFSPDKSKIVICRTKADEHTDFGKFYLYGEELEITDETEHLGVPITSKQGHESAVQARIKKTRQAMFATISFYNPRSFLNIPTKIEVWMKSFRAVLLYSQDTSDLNMSQIRKVESIQTKALRATLGLSRRAKTALIRLLCGAPSMKTLIWKHRFGVLHAILTGETLARHYCLLMIRCRILSSWTLKTITRLDALLRDTEVSAMDFLQRPRPQFKEDLKNLMLGNDARMLATEISNSRIHFVPANPFKNPLPLLMTDFTYRSQRHARSYAAVYTQDFYRNYGSSCFACDSPGLSQVVKESIVDNTCHLMSSACIVAAQLPVRQTLAAVWARLRETFPNHTLLDELGNDELTSRWLLNPTCTSLGPMGLRPDELQTTGIDVLIRTYFHVLLKTRYGILRRKGFPVGGGNKKKRKRTLKKTQRGTTTPRPAVTDSSLISTHIV